MAKKLTVSASPHVRSNETTTGIMLDVIIALIPALVMSAVYFGTRALALTATTVGTAVLAEFLSRKAMKRNLPWYSHGLLRKLLPVMKKD